MSEPLQITIESTADPDTLKVTFNRQVGGTGATYASAEAAAACPPASAAFGVSGVAEVFVLGNFMLLRRKPGTDWRMIGPAVQARLHSILR